MKKNKILKGSPPISVLFTDDINAALCSKIEETANVSQKSELQTLLPTVKAILRVCSFCEHSSKVWQGNTWDFRSCGFGYFLDRFFGFCAQKIPFFGFGIHCGLPIFRILAFGFRFSRKILTDFRI